MKKAKLFFLIFSMSTIAVKEGQKTETFSGIPIVESEVFMAPPTAPETIRDPGVLHSPEKNRSNSLLAPNTPRTSGIKAKSETSNYREKLVEGMNLVEELTTQTNQMAYIALLHQHSCKNQTKDSN